MLEQTVSETLLSQDHCQLECPGLPLAVYREVAAHLRQVEGVQVELLPQLSPTFDYTASQTGGLALCYPPSPSDLMRQQVTAILAHYSDRHPQPWRVLPLA